MFLIILSFLFFGNNLQAMDPGDLVGIKQFLQDEDAFRKGPRSIFYPLEGHQADVEAPAKYTFMAKQFLVGLKNGAYLATRIPIVPSFATMFGTVFLHSAASAPSAYFLLQEEQDVSNLDKSDDDVCKDYCLRSLAEVTQIGISAGLGKLVYGNPAVCLYQIPRRAIGFTIEKSASYALNKLCDDEEEDEYQNHRKSLLWHGRASEGIGTVLSFSLNCLLLAKMAQLTGLFVKYASKFALQAVTQ